MDMLTSNANEPKLGNGFASAWAVSNMHEFCCACKDEGSHTHCEGVSMQKDVSDAVVVEWCVCVRVCLFRPLSKCTDKAVVHATARALNSTFPKNDRKDDASQRRDNAYTHSCLLSCK